MTSQAPQERLRAEVKRIADEMRKVGTSGLGDYYADNDARLMIDWADELEALLVHPSAEKVCGGARIGWEHVGCGTPLKYESTANGLEYWRCPSCGNSHWWPVPAHPSAPQQEK